jgi:hypothetical protein
MQSIMSSIYIPNKVWSCIPWCCTNTVVTLGQRHNPQEHPGIDIWLSHRPGFKALQNSYITLSPSWLNAFLHDMNANNAMYYHKSSSNHKEKHSRIYIHTHNFRDVIIPSNLLSEFSWYASGPHQLPYHHYIIQKL